MTCREGPNFHDLPPNTSSLHLDSHRCLPKVGSDKGLARQVERFIVDHPIPGFAIDKSAPGVEYSSRRPVLVPSIQPTIAIVADGVGLSDLDQYPAVNAAKAGAVAVFSNVFPCPDSLLWFSPDLGTKPVEVVFAGDTATISWSGQALAIRRHNGSCMTSRSG